MPMRLHEVHPSLVHFPVTLLPLAVGADTLGRLTRSRRLMWLGKWAMAGSAVAGALAGVFGLVAQEEVNVEGESMDLLITHRNLNLGVVTLAGALAARRARKERPSLRYLAAGAGAVAGIFYSAYLGGMVVYAHGAGVAPAGGLWDGGGPEISVQNASRLRHAFTRSLGMSLVHLAHEVGKGKIAPGLRAPDPAEEATADPRVTDESAAAA